MTIEVVKRRYRCIHKLASSKCKECKAIYDIQYNINAQIKYKKIISDIGCQACGFNHPNSLEVHHFAKEFKRYKRTSQSQSANVQDINNKTAIVLCANCHLIFHSSYGGRARKFPLLTLEETIEVISTSRGDIL